MNSGYTAQSVPQGKTIAVIGAGIVGICCAAYLVREGHRVILYDRRGPGETTSFGNLGGVQSLAATPLSLPGMLKDVPGWILDQEGPLVIRPRHFPRAAGWLWKFWRESSLERVLHNARALNALNSHSATSHIELAKWAGVSDLIQVPGQLYVWVSRKNYEKAQISRKIWNSSGHDLIELNADQIGELEPDLGRRFEVGLNIPGNGYCRNPYRLCVAIADKAIAEGVEFRREEVNGFVLNNGGIGAVQTDRGVQQVDGVVMAAGMWSKRLLASLGYSVPLESHRGYHVTISSAKTTLSRMLMVIDRKVAITPMETGLRIGGTVELAGLDALPDYRRARSFLSIGASLLPGLDTSMATEWMGHRPQTPDTVPIIGKTDRIANLFLALGHGQMGLLGSAPTGRLIADLVAERKPYIDVTPYRIERFSR
ncbi:D-amino-acid dehydrogenase [Mesorhizobium sp. J18]|uniref:NAD(P)/FAD-dependent oxidoreductase n=1 Tax=Mesorhizobium sp. J18 TaxID=935263 RepID=UPI00119BAEDC|nr:FAD-dependent oxidoreductase [Mesorhizobium sp. J18]TWG91793.1 D-amino-acid dehydrogenase [Mesorhizobium sp. J18]